MNIKTEKLLNEIKMVIDFASAHPDCDTRAMAENMLGSLRNMDLVFIERHEYYNYSPQITLIDLTNIDYRSNTIEPTKGDYCTERNTCNRDVAQGIFDQIDEVAYLHKTHDSLCITQEGYDSIKQKWGVGKL